ncbi:MAG: Hpt domain-containing protein, partial [Planctomycetota bacterium]
MSSNGPDYLDGLGDRDELPYPEPSEMAQYFLEQLRIYTESLEQAWTERDDASLRMLAEELRSSANACDLADVSGSAWILETELSEAAELSAVEEKIEDLIDLCRRSCAARSRP